LCASVGLIKKCFDSFINFSLLIWLSGVWYNLTKASEECAVSFMSKEVCKYYRVS